MFDKSTWPLSSDGVIVLGGKISGIIRYCQPKLSSYSGPRFIKQLHYS